MQTRINPLPVVLLSTGLISTAAYPAPTADSAAAESGATRTTVEAVQHLVWVLSEDVAIASEGGAIALPGAQAMTQYRIMCTAGELTSVTRNFAALVGYGRRTWSVRVKGAGMAAEYAASLRSALTPICNM